MAILAGSGAVSGAATESDGAAVTLAVGAGAVGAGAVCRGSATAGAGDVCSTAARTKTGMLNYLPLKRLRCYSSAPDPGTEVPM